MKALRILFRKKSRSRPRTAVPKPSELPAEQLQQQSPVRQDEKAYRERRPMAPEQGSSDAEGGQSHDPVPRVSTETAPDCNLTDGPSLSMKPDSRISQTDSPLRTFHNPGDSPEREESAAGAEMSKPPPADASCPVESRERPSGQCTAEKKTGARKTKRKEPMMNFIRKTFRGARPEAAASNGSAKHSKGGSAPPSSCSLLRSMDQEPSLPQAEFPWPSNGDQKKKTIPPGQPESEPGLWVEEPASRKPEADFPAQDPESRPDTGEVPGDLSRQKRRNPVSSFVARTLARVASEKKGDTALLPDHTGLESSELASGFKPSYTHTRVVPVPVDNLRSNRIVALDENDPVADQFKLLRTLVFQQTRPKGWSTIQVASFDSGEGSSIVAANLAISIAKDVRQTALLVDLNFRNPSIARLLNLTCDYGLKSYFLDGIGLEQILVNPAIGKLTVLPAGGKITYAPELMGSPKMQQFVKELKERYADRYIIFDTPAASTYPDALVFSEYADAIILVARVDRTTTDNIRATVDLIPREKILGVVMNDSLELE